MHPQFGRAMYVAQERASSRGISAAASADHGRRTAGLFCHYGPFGGFQQFEPTEKSTSTIARAVHGQLGGFATRPGEFLIEHGYAVFVSDKPEVGELTSDWRD